MVLHGCRDVAEDCALKPDVRYKPVLTASCFFCYDRAIRIRMQYFPEALPGDHSHTAELMLLESVHDLNYYHYPEDDILEIYRTYGAGEGFWDRMDREGF